MIIKTCFDFADEQDEEAVTAGGKVKSSFSPELREFSVSHAH